MKTIVGCLNYVLLVSQLEARLFCVQLLNSLARKTNVLHDVG